jgi:hypothetical protein
MDMPEDQVVFKFESFDQIALRAREVLREKGFPDELIDNLLGRSKACDLSMPPPPATNGNASEPDHAF